MIAPGAGTFSLPPTAITFSPTIPLGNYEIVLVADVDGIVTESNENNSAGAFAMSVIVCRIARRLTDDARDDSVDEASTCSHRSRSCRRAEVAAAAIEPLHRAGQADVARLLVHQLLDPAPRAAQGLRIDTGGALDLVHQLGERGIRRRAVATARRRR